MSLELPTHMLVFAISMVDVLAAVSCRDAAAKSASKAKFSFDPTNFQYCGGFMGK